MTRVLLIVMVLGGALGCGERFESSTGAGGAGGGGTTSGTGGSTADPVGCADGKRELFKDENASPNVAGCEGAFDVPGVTTAGSKDPGCGRMAGDDGDNREGSGCAVADLCAEGWHVCESLAELDVSACADDGSSPSFFVTRISTTAGSLLCDSSGNDNLVGCGTDVGQAPEGCGPLDAVLIFSLCDSELDSWDCGGADELEAEVVTKTQGEGGVLCCRD